MLTIQPTIFAEDLDLGISLFKNQTNEEEMCIALRKGIAVCHVLQNETDHSGHQASEKTPTFSHTSRAATEVTVVKEARRLVCEVM